MTRFLTIIALLAAAWAGISGNQFLFIMTKQLSHLTTRLIFGVLAQLVGIQAYFDDV